MFTYAFLSDNGIRHIGLKCVISIFILSVSLATRVFDSVASVLFDSNFRVFVAFVLTLLDVSVTVFFSFERSYSSNERFINKSLKRFLIVPHRPSSTSWCSLDAAAAEVLGASTVSFNRGQEPKSLRHSGQFNEFEVIVSFKQPKQKRWPQGSAMGSTRRSEHFEHWWSFDLYFANLWENINVVAFSFFLHSRKWQ